MLSKTSLGMSSKSLRLSLGIKTILICPLNAARSFSFNPPISKTFPVRVNSPVIAISLRTFLLVIADINDTHNATPADGPSLGVAPSGT